MMTRINYGLHPPNGLRMPFETLAKCAGYNFLCAKRHFEHALAPKPEIFHNGIWIATSREHVKGKPRHFAIGCVELIPLIGHIVALIDRFFAKNASLPIIPSQSPKVAETQSPKPTTPPNGANSKETNQTKATASTVSSSPFSPPETTLETQKNKEAQQEANKRKEPKTNQTKSAASTASSSPFSPPETTLETQKNDEGRTAQLTALGNLAEEAVWPYGNKVPEKPPESPFKESFFNAIPEDLSSFTDLSDVESKALESVRSLTKLLNLTKPLTELPKFPIKLDYKNGSILKLFSVDFMRSVQHPISFDLDGDGWPFVIIKVLNAKDPNIARALYLYSGPLGRACIVPWSGWWEYHCGRTCPSFFSEQQFIGSSGNLLKYSEEVIQRFKDLFLKGKAEDDHKNEWILAPQIGSAN